MWTQRTILSFLRTLLFLISFPLEWQQATFSTSALLGLREANGSFLYADSNYYSRRTRAHSDDAVMRLPIGMPKLRQIWGSGFGLNVSTQSILGTFPDEPHKYLRKTRIICAIGNACNSKAKLLQLLDAGMNVARFNMSHGTHHTHGEALRNLREALALRPHLRCAVLMDTQGPEIRTGFLEEGCCPLQLNAGQELEIIVDLAQSTKGNASRISMNYAHLATTVKPGDIILCADGEVLFRVLECDPDAGSIRVRVLTKSALGERKNVCLPGAKIKLPGITEKDRDDIINFGIANHVDIISGSFTRTAENVKALRACLGEAGKNIRVHAKIESVEALHNCDEILRAADGIHVSRGDLGMELPPHKVFLAQKMLISKANALGKTVVTSTQTLNSMKVNPVPTHAEFSDVANAVLDGTDCIMLSGETASGLFPDLAVRTMARILVQAEQAIDSKDLFFAIRNEAESVRRLSSSASFETDEAMAAATVETSLDMESALLVVIAETRRLPELVAKFRPACPIAVVMSDHQVATHVSCACRGIVLVNVVPSLEEQNAQKLLDGIIDVAKHSNIVYSGDNVVCLHAGEKKNIHMIQKVLIVK